MPRQRPPAPPLAQLSPMLLIERHAIPAAPDWTWEIKYDGYRMLASTGPAPQLRTRNGADATGWFPEIVATLATLPAGVILDGEICVLDELGRSDFERVHARARRRRWYAGADLVTYCTFDQLATGGQDLRAEPIEQRRAALAKLFAKRPAHFLRVQAIDDGAWLYSQALGPLQLEGVVGKRAGSTYQSGARSPDWIKVKRPGAIPPQRFER